MLPPKLEAHTTLSQFDCVVLSANVLFPFYESTRTKILGQTLRVILKDEELCETGLEERVSLLAKSSPSEWGQMMADWHSYLPFADRLPASGGNYFNEVFSVLWDDNTDSLGQLDSYVIDYLHKLNDRGAAIAIEASLPECSAQLVKTVFRQQVASAELNKLAIDSPVFVAGSWQSVCEHFYKKYQHLPHEVLPISASVSSSRSAIDFDFNRAALSRWDCSVSPNLLRFSKVVHIVIDTARRANSPLPGGVIKLLTEAEDRKRLLILSERFSVSRLR